jgi:hypothetical protein
MFPVVSPDTAPEEATVAIAVLLLLHVPPLVASVHEVMLPVHTNPDVLIGAGFTLLIATLAVL